MDTRVACSWAVRSASAAVLLLAGAGFSRAMAEVIPCDGSATQVRLLVRVAGVDEPRGNVTMTVYPDSSDRFLAKGGKLARQRVAAQAPTTSACFVLPAAGQYAIAIYHDVNDDHDFNRSFVGMPNEGFGFSRNPKTKLGLPSLSEVRFAAAAGDNPVEIRLTYP